MSYKKTPDEILKNYSFKANMTEPPGGTFRCVQFNAAVEACNEYADHETAPLKQRIQELETRREKLLKDHNDMMKRFIDERFKNKELKRKSDRMAEALDFSLGFPEMTAKEVNENTEKAIRLGWKQDMPVVHFKRQIMVTALNDYRGIK